MMLMNLPPQMAWKTYNKLADKVKDAVKKLLKKHCKQLLMR